MTQHCKSCRRDLDESKYADKKTCEECRVGRKAKRKTIKLQDCQDIAVLKGGRCLSTKYVNSNVKMLWRCSVNHEWSTKFSHIKRGTWCSRCNSDNQRTSLDDCQKLAKTKGGKCLSTVYVNNKSNVTWQCSQGHQWETSQSSIYRGHWCPTCSGSNSEKMCRDIFERNLMEKFPNTRPKFMEGLELDGYNADLNIAFEYNGIQHYEYCAHDTVCIFLNLLLFVVSSYQDRLDERKSYIHSVVFHYTQMRYLDLHCSHLIPSLP